MGMSSNNLKGFGELHCPNCNEDYRFTLDLDDCGLLRCSGCDGEFNTGNILDLIKGLRDRAERWELVVRWTETAPLCRKPDPA